MAGRGQDLALEARLRYRMFTFLLGRSSGLRDLEGQIMTYLLLFFSPLVSHVLATLLLSPHHAQILQPKSLTSEGLTVNAGGRSRR